MKLHQSITLCLAVITGIAANGCFAQSTANQPQSISYDDSQNTSGAAMQTAMPENPAPLGKTREQVERELVEFQNSPQAARMQELYRGN